MRVKFLFILALAGALVLPAAESAESAGLPWTRVGSSGIDLGLAGLAGGPVSEVAFSPDGSILYARTGPGRVWQSADLGKSWSSYEVAGGTNDPFSLRPSFVDTGKAPAGEPEAQVAAHPFRRSYLFALGRDLYRSSDGGESWVNLTQGGFGSIIGPWQSSIAFSPLDTSVVVVANSAGIWKSADLGLTWVSLNESLPNFPAGRLRPPATPNEPPRIFVAGFGELERPPFNGGAWHLSPGLAAQWRAQFQHLPADDRLRRSLSPLATPPGLTVSYRVWLEGVAVSDDLTACGESECADPAAHYVSAFGGNGDGAFYLGTSDGRIWTSYDAGLTWRRSLGGLPATTDGVAALFVSPLEPRAAVAVFRSAAGGRIFRTTNGGIFWDDLTADLPEGAIEALAADPETGALYVAGEAGVFYTMADLSAPWPPAPWRDARGNLPEAAVNDLMLDRVTGRLYALVEGFGVYRVRAPAVMDSLRVLNAADLTRRAAAPGGLLTVLGGGLTTASVRGISAPVLLSGPYEAQIQVPFEAGGSQLALALRTSNGATQVTYPLAEVSPAIFVDRGNPLVLDAGTGVLLDQRRPAVAGSHVLVLATGLGAVQPDWPTGVPAPLEDPPATVHPVKAYLNGAPLKVISSALAGGYIGTYLVEIEIPAVLNAGTGELAIEVGGQRSNSVRIYTEP